MTREAPDDLAGLEEKIGCRFTDKSLLKRALTHASGANRYSSRFAMNRNGRGNSRPTTIESKFERCIGASTSPPVAGTLPRPSTRNRNTPKNSGANRIRSTT